MKRKTPDENETAKEGPLQPIWQTALDVFEILLQKGYPCRALVLIGPFADVARLIEPRVNLIVEGKDDARKNMKALFRKPYDRFDGFLFRSHGPQAYLSMVDMEHFLRGDLFVVSEDDGSANITYHCSGAKQTAISGGDMLESVKNLPEYTVERERRPLFTLSRRFAY